MRDYNGFTSNERQKAHNWLRGQIKAGHREPAEQNSRGCDACGQEQGTLQYHSEDYSAPYGDNIGAFLFCYPCHMIIHCRFKSPDAWHTYRDHVRRGFKLTLPFWGRNWHRFTREVLKSPGGLDWVRGASIDYAPVLDQIEVGTYDPRKRTASA